MVAAGHMDSRERFSPTRVRVPPPPPLPPPLQALLGVQTTLILSALFVLWRLRRLLVPMYRLLDG